MNENEVRERILSLQKELDFLQNELCKLDSTQSNIEEFLCSKEQDQILKLREDIENGDRFGYEVSFPYKFYAFLSVEIDSKCKNIKYVLNLQDIDEDEISEEGMKSNSVKRIIESNKKKLEKINILVKKACEKYGIKEEDIYL